MDLQYHYHGNELLVVNVTAEDGTLAGSSINEFIEEVIELAHGKVKRVALDFTGKKYLNSSGLGDLIMVRDCFHDEDLSLVLIGVQENIRSLLDMVGIENFFTLIKDEGQLDKG